jgi:hypothetical protein
VARHVLREHGADTRRRQQQRQQQEEEEVSSRV